MRIVFPEKEYLEGMLLDEDREVYKTMSQDQKRVVRFAYYYGLTKKEKI